MSPETIFWIVVVLVGYRIYRSAKHSASVIYGREEGEEDVARYIKQTSAPKSFVWREIDSHGPADLIARFESGARNRPDIIWYIQVKSSLDGNAPMPDRQERQALLDLCAQDRRLGVVPVVALNHSSGENRDFEFYSIGANLDATEIDVP